MRAGVRIGYPTGNLLPFDPFHGVGKGARWIVAGLDFHTGKVERAAVDSRRSARFKTADLKSEGCQTFRGLFCRGFTRAPRAIRKVANVDLTFEKGAGRQDDAVREVGDTSFHADTADPT